MTKLSMTLYYELDSLEVFQERGYQENIESGNLHSISPVYEVSSCAATKEKRLLLVKHMRVSV